MIAYFRDLLATLKAIEAHLALIASCVKKPRRWEGNSLTTRDYNDNGPI